NRNLTRLEIAVLSAGMMAVGVWLGSQSIPVLWQRWDNWVFESRAHRQADRHQVSPPALENNAVVGRLSIPRLPMHTMVREGVDESTLLLAAGHIRGTALPGSSGNVALAGHRDTWFSTLANIRMNDRIEFETYRGLFEYRVVSTEIVKPDDVKVLKSGG